MALRVTDTSIYQWRGRTTQVIQRLSVLTNWDYNLASIIQGAAELVEQAQKIKNLIPGLPGTTGTPTFEDIFGVVLDLGERAAGQNARGETPEPDDPPQDPPKPPPKGRSSKVKKAALKLAKKKLTELLDAVDTGESRDEIREEIWAIAHDIEKRITQKFDDCVENLPSDSRSQGGMTVTGYKIDEVFFRVTVRLIDQAIELCDKYAEFNITDLKDALSELIDDAPGFIADQIESYIFQRISGMVVDAKQRITAVKQELLGLKEYFDPNLYPECKTPTTQEEEKEKRKVPEPEVEDDTPAEEPPKGDDDKDEPPTKTGDCCNDLIAAINNLNKKQGIDYNRIEKLLEKNFKQRVLPWARETRIELKEARVDLKTKVIPGLEKLYNWIRDLRIEHFSHWQTTQKLQREQQKIAKDVLDVKLDIAEIKDEVIELKRIVEIGQLINNTNAKAIMTLISGVSNAIGSSLAAILAAIEESKTEVIKEMTSGFSKLDTTVTAGFLTVNKSILDLRLQMAKGFTRIEDLFKDIKDEFGKIRLLMLMQSSLMQISFTMLISLIGGVSLAIAAALGAILAEIAAATTAITTGLTAGFTAVEASLATGFLKTQVELLQMRLAIARGFNRLEDLLGIRISGKLKSFDTVEMTDKEKKKVDEEEKKKKEEEEKNSDKNDVQEGAGLLAQFQFFKDNPITPAFDPEPTPTGSLPTKYIKIEEQNLEYEGRGLLGIEDMIYKQSVILNDIQTDIRLIGGAFELVDIEVPVVLWYKDVFPVIKEKGKEDKRDYKNKERLLEVAKLDGDGDGEKEFSYLVTPEYSLRTPYFTLVTIKVPKGMEKTYFILYEQNMDAFWYQYQNPPTLLMPDGWELRPFRYRSQLQVRYVEVKDDGSFNRQLNYTMNIQHYDFKRLGKPEESPVPPYKKGKTMGIMELADGSKNVIFAVNKEEALKVFRAMKEVTIPEMVEDIDLTSEEKNSIRWGENDTAPSGESIKEINVAPVWADYFNRAKLNRTYNVKKDWRVFFDRANLPDK